MIRSKAAIFLVLGILFLTNAEEIDDSDYPEIYDDYYPIFYKQNFEDRLSKKIPDDFYIINEAEETENHPKVYSPSIEDLQEFDNHNIIYSTTNKIPQTFLNREDSKIAITAATQKNWYKEPEKIYRYTKHRIPGYDYDEFDIFGDSVDRQCDEKSVWTHCLCQFTCTDPNSVNCYSPCETGCECREEFVFDERIQKCVLPAQCEMTVDYFYDFET